jgi:ankyrin repeat protein
MANWYYYKRIGSITSAALQELARQGVIMPETIIENEDGKMVRAKKCRGLIFPDSDSPSAEKEITSDIIVSLAKARAHEALAALYRANSPQFLAAWSKAAENLEIQSDIVDAVFSPEMRAAGAEYCETKNNHALHKAVEANNTEAVAAFIKEGADVNAMDDNGFTPLHIAVRHNATASIAVLIKEGADVNAVNKDGLTPMQLDHNQAVTFAFGKALNDRMENFAVE